MVKTTNRPCLERDWPRPPPVVNIRTDCPDEFACYPIPEAARIAAWVADARRWMRNAWTLCGPEEEDDEE